VQLSEESVWAGQPVEELPVCKSHDAGTKVQILTAVFTGTKVQILTGVCKAQGGGKVAKEQETMEALSY
jgi:hypothetical protein